MQLALKRLHLLLGLLNGTLYYHFSSKEEIFNFLIEEGMKLLQNSMTIKVQNCHTLRDKLKAILLIQIKVMVKYQDFMTIVLSEVLGNDSRNLTCRKFVFEYIDMLENIICESVKNR